MSSDMAVQWFPGKESLVVLHLHLPSTGVFGGYERWFPRVGSKGSNNPAIHASCSPRSQIPRWHYWRRGDQLNQVPRGEESIESRFLELRSLGTGNRSACGRRDANQPGLGTREPAYSLDCPYREED
jgi:hypothetical protein